MKHALIIIAISMIAAINCFASDLKTIKNENITNDKIWLTFDACDGEFDLELANFLVENKIKNSIFVTSKWISKNPNGVLFLNEHKDIFDIQNHGENHFAPIFEMQTLYNVKTVENEIGLIKEYSEGEKSIEKAFNITPKFYRGATATYSKDVLDILKINKVNIAGYTIAADIGATASKEKVFKAISMAKPNDIILMHINKPKSDTFEGVKLSLALLKDKVGLPYSRNK